MRNAGKKPCVCILQQNDRAVGMQCPAYTGVSKALVAHLGIRQRLVLLRRSLVGQIVRNTVHECALLRKQQSNCEKSICKDALGFHLKHMIPRLISEA